MTTNWSFVAATYDASSGKVTIVQEPAISAFSFDSTRAVTERTTTVKGLATNAVPVLIAATRAPAGGTLSSGHYNGKIDNPRFTGGR